MTLTKKLILGLTAGLITLSTAVYEYQKPPRSDQYCDVLPCTPCDLDGSDPLMEDCGGQSGELCCNLSLEICSVSGEGECPGMQMWCDDYTQEPDGTVECHDIWGQGAPAQP